MGSSEASVVTLRGLLKAPQLRVVGVVTQPDRPSGRHQRFTPCPCNAYAAENRIGPIITPEKVNAPEVLQQIEKLKPDVIVVVAFGQILGKRLLALPPRGCINGHFSLLPKHRGAAPVQASIAAGDEVTGVTIMQMNDGMDEGDILLKAIEPICSDDTSVSLMDRLAILCAVAMIKALKMMRAGTLLHEPQDDSQATYASKMQKADGLIDWTIAARLIERRTRAFDPWPGAFTFLPALPGRTDEPERIKVLQADVLRQNIPGFERAAPGTICQLSSVGPIVATGNGFLCLTAVQPDGSRRMDGKSFLNGRKIIPGDCFTNSPEEKPTP